MKLTIIAAVSTDGVIGIDNNIPWHIPEDFKHFRETTIGHTLIVGYTTYLTLPEKAFEKRNYIVLNSDSKKEFDVLRENVIQYNNIESLLKYVEDLQHKETIFVAGGARIYNLFIEYCDNAIITWVKSSYPQGNKTFPIDKLYNNFQLVGKYSWKRSKNGMQYKICYYKLK